MRYSYYLHDIDEIDSRGKAQSRIVKREAVTRSYPL